MDLHEAMRTTFAARDFTSDPVPDAALFRILDAARFAPSGGNRQGWRVIEDLREHVVGQGIGGEVARGERRPHDVVELHQAPPAAARSFAAIFAFNSAGVSRTMSSFWWA